MSAKCKGADRLGRSAPSSLDRRLSGWEAGLGDDLSGLCAERESNRNEQGESGGESDHLGHGVNSLVKAVRCVLILRCSHWRFRMRRGEFSLMSFSPFHIAQKQKRGPRGPRFRHRHVREFYATMRAARAKAEIATGANNTKAAAIEPNLAALVKALNLVMVIPSDMNSLLVSEMPRAQFIDAQRPTFLSATLPTSCVA